MHILEKIVFYNGRSRRCSTNSKSLFLSHKMTVHMSEVASTPIKLRAVLELRGKTATGIVIPGKIVEKLDSGKKPKVVVVVNGYTFRSSIAFMGGEFLLGFSADVRKAAKIAAGDAIDVQLKLDTEERKVTVPADLQELLNKNSKLQHTFQSLSFSKQRALVEPIEAAKANDTRNNRIRKVIDMLGEAGKQS
jgi:hypothetical protein